MGKTLNRTVLENSIRHHFNVERYASGLVKDLLGILNAADQDIADKLRARLETEEKTGRATTRSLQQLQRELRELSDSGIAGLRASMPARLENFAAVEDRAQREIIEAPLGEALGYRFRLKKVSAAALRGIVRSRPWDGALLKDHIRTLGAQRSSAVIRKLNVGMAQGSTVEQIVSSIMGKRVRGGTREKPLYEGGVLDQARHNVRSLVRSYVSHVANETRDDLFQANSDVITGQLWVATLDSNTTPFCQSRDNKLYGLDHSPIGHSLLWDAGPGRSHWQCRSTSIPVLKALDDLPIDWSRVGSGRGQRAAVNRDELGRFIDGQAPESADYTSWLRSQPKAQQIEILGSARSKWFRENPEATVGEAWAKSYKVRHDDTITLRELAAKAGIVAEEGVGEIVH